MAHNYYNGRNNQELFDIVSNHLLTQKQRSVSPDLDEFGDLECMYRSPDGCKCAIGCLISDDEYNPKMEGKSCDSPMVSRAAKLDKNNLSLAYDLQELHDDKEVEEWMEGLKKIANDYELNHDSLNEFL